MPTKPQSKPSDKDRSKRPRRRALPRDERAGPPFLSPTLAQRGRMSAALRAKRYLRLGDALYSARVAAGIRQGDLARALLKQQSFVSKYERGSRRLDVVEFICVATLLGIDAHAVLATVIDGAAGRGPMSS